MTQALRSVAPGGEEEESPGTRRGPCARRIYDFAMNREAKLLWGGFAAAVIGSIQVVSIIIRVASAAGSLTVIHGLQLMFCGSLLVTGILTLYNVWRDHRDGTPDERLLPRSGDR